jgi:hypothetical protein
MSKEATKLAHPLSPTLRGGGVVERLMLLITPIRTQTQVPNQLLQPPITQYPCSLMHVLEISTA